MPATVALSPADREFFEWVARAAFTNPFSPERLEFDQKIANTTFRDETERTRFLQEAVASRVGKLAAGGANLRAYRGEERELMRLVFLFEAYHAFIDRLDGLIRAQEKAGERPVPVPFASEMLALLGQRGFPVEDARRFLGIFFQVRRAFYFIVHGLIGESDCMKAFRLHLWNNVFTHDIRCYDRYLWNRLEDFSTLLLGETGTGKGAAAAAIGRSGFIPFDGRTGCFAESFTQGFVSLNLSQYPESLIESELFGHTKGAFTGAVERHDGVFTRCRPHGSIFLDEIGDVSTPIQIKLLQVLQERTYSPVGSHEKLRFRGRVIAATNQPLDALRREKVFRDDFFYRLCSDVITVPPLRQRLRETPHELKMLVNHLVVRAIGGDAPQLSDLVMESLRETVGLRYGWPGNVRELEQAVRRILLTGRYDGDTGGAGSESRSQWLADLDRGALDAEALLGGYCARLYERHHTIEDVARRTNLDRRTVKRYLDLKAGGQGPNKRPP